MDHLRAAFGMIALITLAWAISTDRRQFPWRSVIGGLVIQFVLALSVLRTQSGAYLFNRIGYLVTVVMAGSDEGARFVFGNLVDNNPGGWGFIFAAKALPTIIVFSALSAVGYHLGILQRVVAGMAWVMQRLMRTSGAESLSAAANVFLGQTEAPLLVRPYIPFMTTSELNAVMVGGFATIAGSLMAVYAAMLGHEDRAMTADFVRHLLTASLMSAPASLYVAKIIIPERQEPETAGTVRLKLERTTVNLIDAAATGALDGIGLAINVAGMLIAFLALIYVLDAVLIWLGGFSLIAPALAKIQLQPLTLNGILGLVFYPIARLISIPAEECRAFGGLLGRAMAANEFIAYKSLADMVTHRAISQRSIDLAVYALCGFANFSSIAIQIAGIGGMAPTRRTDLARIGLRAMIGGAISCWLTACVAGILI